MTDSKTTMDPKGHFYPNIPVYQTTIFKNNRMVDDYDQKKISGKINKISNLYYKENSHYVSILLKTTLAGKTDYDLKILADKILISKEDVRKKIFTCLISYKDLEAYNYSNRLSPDDPTYELYDKNGERMYDMSKVLHPLKTILLKKDFVKKSGNTDFTKGDIIVELVSSKFDGKFIVIKAPTIKNIQTVYDEVLTYCLSGVGNSMVIRLSDEYIYQLLKC